MLRYLLKFVCVNLYMYMLSGITFGYNRFNEIFINVKLIFFLILKKHSKYKYYYTISTIAYITTLSYVHTHVTKYLHQENNYLIHSTHNENIEHILNLHINHSVSNKSP